ncbi:MAG: patatin-like phospholipase family protein [Leptospiraceae bacterium]|nr:patatin-like phospholipase family protein [Leptospiraceae bacterium]
MKFKILSIDGGGIRGVYPAHILQRIEENFSIKCGEHFNMIAGTSTGSIIAAALAMAIPAQTIKDMYFNHGADIFQKQFGGALKLFKSRYSMHQLKSILYDVFKDKRLGEISAPLMIFATNIVSGCVHVFKSAYSQDFVRDQNVKIVDAVMASCAAPTFFDPHRMEDYMLSDGGLWANNPSLAAYIEATTRLNQPPANVKVFSIGTGTGKTVYSFHNIQKKWWGFLTGWRREALINLILNSQSESTSNMVKLLLKDNYLRINFNSDKELSLDQAKWLPHFKSYADSDFTHNSKQIREFIEIQ